MKLPHLPLPLRHRWLAFATLAAVLVASGVFITMTQDNVIVLRDDGFHPRTLTIRAGETVTFETARGKYFWPASDFHPTHTQHPDFDPRVPIAPDASWSYTFETPGIYKFHDHLGAYYSGIITVTDEAGGVVNDCMQHGGQLECWQTKIFLELAQKGVDAAYEVIAALYEREPGFAQSCHYLAHNVGLASYQFFREDPSFIYSPRAVACAAGFYHGFMEGYLGATGDYKEAAAICDTIGEAVGRDAPDARLQCYHGIGHGAIETAVAGTGSFSLRDAVDQAVTQCGQASEGSEERYRCVSGVYNAIANFYIAGEYGLSPKTSNPFDVCARQPEVYREACYGNMNSVAMWQGQSDFARAVPYVTNIPEVEYRAKAVWYLANLAALQYVGTTTSFAPMNTACNALKTYRLDCVRGFAHGLLEHGSPDQEYVRALAFCAEPGLGVGGRAACYEETLGMLGGWYSDIRAREVCAAAPIEARQYCTTP